MPRDRYRLLVFVLISSIGYLILGYFTSRDQTLSLFTIYFILFGAYLTVYRYTPSSQISYYLYIAIGLRLLLLISTPSLSDDIYRFIWDGRLLLHGVSPFSALPVDYMHADAPTVIGIDDSLFRLLNSPEYFTVYPPLSQLIFWLSALVSPLHIKGSIVTMRVLVLVVEIGSIVLIKKLLAHYQLPAKNILLYSINPLVIIELTGNLHYEAFVIFFLLLTIYLVVKDKLLYSGISWSVAIGFKLIPLIFLPLAIRRFGVKKQLLLFAVVGISTILLFLPLYDEALIKGLQSSLTLYFQKFEFNASIYYLLRSIGYWVKGYNIITQLGPALAIITFASIMAYSVSRKQRSTLLPVAMMWGLLIYLSLATTVHPWYITTLVALSVFSHYRFAILWSLLIFLTYAGYSAQGYDEPVLLIILGYSIAILYILYELFSSKLLPRTTDHTE